MNEQEIKQFRKSLNMTQQEFAQVLHVGIRTVCRWEKGETGISQLAQANIKALQQEVENGKRKTKV